MATSYGHFLKGQSSSISGPSFDSDNQTVIFATGVLSIPSAMYALRALGAALSVIGWGALNTWSYFALFQLPIMYGSVRFMEVGLDIGNTQLTYMNQLAN